MKSIKIPTKRLDVVEGGEKTGGTVGVFQHLAGLLIESTPQKTDTESYLAHAIRLKLNATTDQDETIDLEEAELAFLQGGIDKLRARDAITGSNWYYIIDALRSAHDKKREGA